MFLQKLVKREKGFTLTEAAIVLGIMGLILGAIWVAAASVYKNMRVNRTSEQILTIAQNLRSLYATQTTFDSSSITSVTWANIGVIPKDLVVYNGTAINAVKNAWGGDVTISAQTGVSTNDSFSIQYTDIPRDVCSDLLVRTTGAGRDPGLIGAAAAASNSTEFPMSAATAATICATDGNANTLTFTFRLRN